MHPASRPEAARWLVENGPKALELSFWTIIYGSFAPILIADDDRICREVSFGAIKLLGFPREEIIGRSVDDFADPSYKPLISERWRALRDRGEQVGTLRLVGRTGPRDVDYIAKGNVLPVRHLLVLQDVPKYGPSSGPTRDGYEKAVPSWVQDFALFLLDLDGLVVTWYSGAERIYGYSGDEAIGQKVAFLNPIEDTFSNRLEEELERSKGEGHFGNECWQVKKGGVRFWASVMTVALRNEYGDLQGFARVVRDFSDRQRRDEELRLSRARSRPLLSASTSAAIVAGEFDQAAEVNDTFLELVGYSREDLRLGHLRWPRLTPPEYLALDELAHEEVLQFGACAPVEKELIRKDGKRVPVLAATAVLKLSPFRWITFLRELDERGGVETNERKALKDDGGGIVGSSAAIKRILGQIDALASTDATVLVLGESGTGKQLVARTIHRMSPRRDLPFVRLNCANIPVGLLEGELFGYERGAFSGAVSHKAGRLEMADQGTLLLEEVGEVPLELAAKLVRALHEKVFERLGGTRKIRTDVRLLATTNLNMHQMVGDRLFRSDFFYQLKVFPIIVPPLRDRAEDIPALAWHFTKKYAAQMNRTIDKIPAGTMKAMESWRWPRNVQELENFIERSVTVTRGPTLTAPLSELRVDLANTASLAEVEREHILRIFRETGGVISATAARLRIPRSTLNAMMKKLGVSRNDL
ncbi:MAG: sigma 54-interacting transcriptional regulator [Bryobacteraceae bacterium]|jgi:PAS domain S-box-containing protein